MDITLVRQAQKRSEIVKGKKIEYIDISGISDLSKSSLRILYECGKRPLYAFLNPKSDSVEISVVSSPQKEADCLLCGNEQNSFQSASVLKEQLSDGGVDFPIMKLAALSDTSTNTTQKHLAVCSLQQKLSSLKEKGCQHVIIVADSVKLNDIYHVITKENLPDLKGKTYVWGIRNGRLAYSYSPQVVDYLTEGLLDSKLVSMINGSGCPETLKKFQGKIKKPINEYKLFYDLRQQQKS